MTNQEAVEILTGRKTYGSTEPEKRGMEWDEALILAVKALQDIETIQKAYESDYQVQDVIEVCAELWG